MRKLTVHRGLLTYSLTYLLTIDFAAGTIKHAAGQGLQIPVRFMHSYLWDAAIWQKQGKLTLFAIGAVAAVV